MMKPAPNKKLEKADLIHLRSGPDPRILQPVPFSISIYPALLDEQISLLRLELEKVPEEDRGIVQQSLNVLQEEKENSPVFEAFFRPIKLGEWSRYRSEKLKTWEVVQRHVTTSNGEPYFSPDEAENVRNPVFVNAVYDHLLEASGLTGAEIKNYSLLYQATMIELERRRRSRQLKTGNEESNESREASPPSSSENAASSPGRSQN